MAYYGVIFPEFWTGSTGRQLREQGGRDAQVLALYLMSSPHANMLGLYQLPPLYIREESGLSQRALVAALAFLQAQQFAFYDAATQYVWVKEMARFRMGLSADKPALEKNDKRCLGARRVYDSLPANPFLGLFYDRYAKSLHLGRRREGPQQVGLGSPFQAPPKPVTESETVSGTGSGTEKSTGAFAPARTRPVEISVPSHAMLCVIAAEVLDTEPPDSSDADLKDAIKSRCARLHLAYDHESVRKALDAVQQRKATA